MGKSTINGHIFYSYGLISPEGNLCRKTIPAKAPSGKSPWISSIRDKACGGKPSLYLKKTWRFIWRKTLVEVFFVYNLSLSLSLLVLLPLLYINIIYKSWTILRFLPNFCENNSGMTDDWATHLGSSSQTCSTHLKHTKQIILSSRDESAEASEAMGVRLPSTLPLLKYPLVK